MMLCNIKDVVALAKANGSHWFDPDTIRWFDCKVHPVIYGNKYFITSEAWDKVWDGKRRWSIREVSQEPFGIATVGEFGQYESFEEALEGVHTLSPMSRPPY